MTNVVNVMGNDVAVKEYRGKRVVTFRDIDTVHQRPEGTAGRNFRENRNRFVENVDYFSVCQADEIRRFGFERPQGGVPKCIILVTESGYLMLVKSFTDDLAWEVQRCLVNTYFKIHNVECPQNYKCELLTDTQLIAKWKRTVVLPMTTRLANLLETDNFVKAYTLVYKDMTEKYAFDMNSAREVYSVKYSVPFSQCAVIDTIADNSDFRRQFVKCCEIRIKEMSEDRLKKAEREVQIAGEYLTYSEKMICKAQSDTDEIENEWNLIKL